MQFVLEGVISLQPLFKRNGKPKKRSKVFINGKDVNCILDGIILDRCIKIYSYYLLFVSYYQKDDEKDVVFIYLLTQEGKILDEARVLVRFLDPCDYLIDPEGFVDSYFGYLKSIKLIVPNKITFRFADNF